MKKLFVTALFAICIFISNAQTDPGGLKVNDKAPDFLAKDQNGKIISLTDELRNGEVVLIFYRGQWCLIATKN